MNGRGVMNRLSPVQALASTPGHDVWLSASAGTGKTQVLTARVIRLLLRGVAPESILCLTFTKGAAAEMAGRINARLSHWVRASETDIKADLFALHENPHDAALVAQARTLFARVLSSKANGLRIQTIHSFCQTLLANFPTEAKLLPGFKAMEERETRALAHQRLSEISETQQLPDHAHFIAQLGRFSLRNGEKATTDYLMTCTASAESFARLGQGLVPKLRLSLGLPLESALPLIVQGCADSKIDRALLKDVMDMNFSKGTARCTARAEKIAAWLALDDEARAAQLDRLVSCWTKADGTFLGISKGFTPMDASYYDMTEELAAHFNPLLEIRALENLADHWADAAQMGQAFARNFAEAKDRRGLVDFNDLIQRSAQLLTQPGISEWIRYKLDQSVDHILVDEAQDTNAHQWAIIKALAEDFYSGHIKEPQGKAGRSIFVVGDTKQAIFGFQGSDPQAMHDAQAWFAERNRWVDRELLTLNLVESYRSSPPILGFVDQVIAQVGADGLGLNMEYQAHVAAQGCAGRIDVYPLVEAEGAQAEEAEPLGEESWETPANRILATQIAQQVAQMLKDETLIEVRGAKPHLRAVRPMDIMILLRSRSDLAQLIVARLIEAGVPVAGVDRLKLRAPLAVRDCMAAIRFALQPLDDLNLACLLVSPLLGWTQEELQAAALGRPKDLWRHLRQHQPAEALAPLTALLNMGDRLTPTQFLEALLTGALRGRQKMIVRFGEEALDPLDELLNAAFEFERTETPSLQGFLAWFDQGEVDVKREAESQADAVRVMTVHGAKGLQAPIVILADAARAPGGILDRVMQWPIDDESLPLPRPRKPVRTANVEVVVDAAKQRDLKEHYRLLYVALTRAEERLIICGVKTKQKISEDCWYLKAQAALVAMGGVETADGLRYDRASDISTRKEKSVQAPAAPAPRPLWLDALPPQEVRPPKPLAPSKLGEDLAALPPGGAQNVMAAQRGKTLHALFERLPTLPPATRRAQAMLWLGQAMGVSLDAERQRLVDDALRVIEDPQFANLFAADALTEAPLAGVVNDVAIAGTVDRLVLTADSVTVVDYKTTTRPPQSSGQIPEAHVRQMAAYVAVLQSIFPQQTVRAALLYTHTPALHWLSDAQMAAHKPSYQHEQQVLQASA